MNRRNAPADTADKGLSREEAGIIEKRHRLRAPVIYEIVREEGEEELQRPVMSLWWSALTAGLAMGFSLVAEAALRIHLPETPWRPLVANAGYTIGFIIVILGRQQLFTENTITPILPLVARFSMGTLRRVALMWLIVFAANMAGTFVFALFNTLLPGTSPAIHDAMLAIGREGMRDGWFDMMIGAIGAGFLIAAIVWLIPSAEGAKLLVVFIFTYLIGIAGFHHIIAGSADAFLLLLGGEMPIADVVLRFMLPVFIGNIIGGTALFALLSYAQVMREIED